MRPGALYFCDLAANLQLMSLSFSRVWTDAAACKAAAHHPLVWASLKSEPDISFWSNTPARRSVAAYYLFMVAGGTWVFSVPRLVGSVALVELHTRPALNVGGLNALKEGQHSFPTAQP